MLNMLASKPGLSSKRSNKTNLESRKQNQPRIDQILAPVSILMDPALVLNSAIFPGKTLLMALSVGQGRAAIQLGVMDNAPGWNKTPEALAQR